MRTSLKNKKTIFLGLALSATVLFLAQIAVGWTGPTTTPPTGNVNAPINTGSTDQTKNASLGVNGLAVFGNAIMSGSSRYLNWGSTSGSSGYGLRDNGGTMEYKNSGGSWAALSTPLGWIVSGNDIYNANSANVGVGMTVPAAKFSVSSASSATLTNFTQAVSSSGILIETTYTADNYTPGLFWRTTDDNATKPKAGIWLQETSSGTNLYFGTSNSYTTGITNSSMRLDPTANLYATAFLYASDRRLKDDIGSLKDGLKKILALSPVSFTWKEGASARARQEDIGFIAQEVEEIVPEAVHTDSEGYKSVDYARLMPVLVQAIQEQQAEIGALKAEVEALKAQ